MIHPVAIAFYKGTSKIKKFCELDFVKDNIYYGREPFHYHIWALLKDTNRIKEKIDIFENYSTMDENPFIIIFGRFLRTLPTLQVK